MKSLTDKQKIIAKGKLLNKKNSDIGAEVYPDANKTSQRQLVYRELQKPHVKQYIEQEKTVALKKYGFTWDRILKKLDSKIDATKSDFHTGALIDDNPTQMAALKAVIGLIDSKQVDTDVKEQLASLPDVNEIELQRLLFRKKN